MTVQRATTLTLLLVLSGCKPNEVVAPPTKVETLELKAPVGVTLEEVTKAAGIDFKHVSGALPRSRRQSLLHTVHAETAHICSYPSALGIVVSTKLGRCTVPVKDIYKPCMCTHTHCAQCPSRYIV